MITVIQRLREAIATRGKPRMEAAIAAVEQELAAKDAEIAELKEKLHVMRLAWQGCREEYDELRGEDEPVAFCPRGHEYNCEKEDICPRCLDDADALMDALRNA